MIISLSSLATTSKFQKNVCFKMRAVSLININTKECESGRHVWKWSMAAMMKVVKTFMKQKFSHFVNSPIGNSNS